MQSFDNSLSDVCWRQISFHVCFVVIQDIFRMNQKMLEGAVRRIGADQTLEPARKAYLMQHIMASRYIVAQQQGKVRLFGNGFKKRAIGGYPTYRRDFASSWA